MTKQSPDQTAARRLRFHSGHRQPRCLRVFPGSRLLSVSSVFGSNKAFAAKQPKTEQRKEHVKMILDVTLPHQPFNAAVKDGTVGSKLNRILEATKSLSEK